jgi:hypothetical protein
MNDIYEEDFYEDDFQLGSTTSMKTQQSLRVHLQSRNTYLFIAIRGRAASAACPPLLI